MHKGHQFWEENSSKRECEMLELAVAGVLEFVLTLLPWELKVFESSSNT